MADDPKFGWWEALREKAGSPLADLLASATFAGGIATAASHPSLSVIIAIMITSRIHTLARSIMKWHVRLRHQHMQWSYQRQHQKITAKLLKSPADEGLRALLILHAVTRPDHLGPPPAAS
jgi:hypothetical protein